MNAAWDTIRLGSAGAWFSGGTPNTDEDAFWGGDIPWMSSKSLTNFYVRDSDRRLTPLGVQNGTKLVPESSILMVVRGMSLKTEFRMGIAEREVAISQDLKALVPNEAFEPLFLAYALKSNTSQILNLVDEAGHGTGRLQTELLHNVRVPIPARSEQRAIAETLGALDDKIESNRRQQQLLSELASGFFDAAISLGGTIAVKTSDVVQHRPGKYLAKELYGNGDYVVYGSNSVMGRHDEFLYSGPFAILARIGSYCGALTWSEDPAWVNNNASALIPQDTSSPWLIREALNRIDMSKFRAGSGQPFIEVNALMDSFVELPHDDSMPGLGALLEAISKRENGLQAESMKLRRLRDALLPELLSGRIRVTEAVEHLSEVV